MSEDKLKKWKEGYRIVMICGNCKDEIYSNYSGEFVKCKCGNCAIDQTTHYTRYLGSGFTTDYRIIEECKRS